MLLVDWDEMDHKENVYRFVEYPFSDGVRKEIFDTLSYGENHF